MYDNLLSLPYFQGMSKDDITSILDKITLEFFKYSDKEVVCNQGCCCDRFLILIQGKLEVVATSPDNSFTLTEEITAPYAVEPYSMFGNKTNYNREYRAKDKCTILVIDKRFLFSEFYKHGIFTINFLNLLCSKSQKLEEVIWTQAESSIAGRIYRFIASRCELQHGQKVLSIKMEELASMLCETRLNISKALNEMQEAGVAVLHRKEISIPSLDKLADYIKEKKATKK